MPALQASGYDQLVEQNMPYADGVIGVLLGNVQNDGNIITQDLNTAMTNVGFVTDDLTRFLVRLDDNIKAASVADPSVDQTSQAFFRALYFTYFLEYLRLYSVTDKFVPPEGIYQLAQSKGVAKDALDKFLNLQVVSKNMYSISVKDPAGVRFQLCPWLYVYNNGGKVRLFLTKEEMEQYDRKFGKMNLPALLRKNLHIAGIGVLAMIAIGIGVIILGKRKSNKKKKLEEEVMAELAAGDDAE